MENRARRQVFQKRLLRAIEALRHLLRINKRGFASAGQISIFPRPADFTKGLPISLMEFAGLGIVHAGYSTLIFEETNREAATLVDRLIVAMFYRDDSPESPTEAALLAFWQKHIDAVYQDTLIMLSD